jgi:hypothetical protein
VGKVDRTADEIFDDHVQNFNKQQNAANKLQKELNNYIRCVKGEILLLLFFLFSKIDKNKRVWNFQFAFFVPPSSTTTTKKLENIPKIDVPPLGSPY